jgi:acyl carrier protein
MPPHSARLVQDRRPRTPRPGRVSLHFGAHQGHHQSRRSEDRPPEVEDALAQHPSIVEAAAFALPHPTLGEDVAAAVVLTGKRPATESELRDFVRARLAAFKVPTRIYAVPELPRGPLGKVRRGELARIARRYDPTEYVPPRDPEEAEIVRIFADVLGLERIGAEDNFFQLGGDSLRGTRVIARLEASFGVTVSADGVLCEAHGCIDCHEVRAARASRTSAWHNRLRPSRAASEPRALTDRSFGERGADEPAMVRRILVAAGCLWLGAAPAFGENYPTRPIRLIVGFPPGAQSDAAARLVGGKLSALLGQPVVIDNHGGASGAIASELAARAPADGYTLLLGSISNLTMAPLVIPNLRYDPVGDFVAIRRFARVPFVIGVNSKIPAATLGALVDYARQHPGELTCATGAPINQLAIQMLTNLSSTDIVHVRYKGTAAASPTSLRVTSA